MEAKWRGNNIITQVKYCMVYKFVVCKFSEAIYCSHLLHMDAYVYGIIMVLRKNKSTRFESREKIFPHRQLRDRRKSQ